MMGCWSFVSVGPAYLPRALCLVAQPCPTLREYTPGSSVHRVLQARRLKWVAIPFSEGSSQPRSLSPALAGGFFPTSTCLPGLSKHTRAMCLSPCSFTSQEPTQRGHAAWGSIVPPPGLSCEGCMSRQKLAQGGEGGQTPSCELGSVSDLSSTQQSPTACSVTWGIDVSLDGHSERTLEVG